LYEGATPFLITYTTFIPLQFTIYESCLKYFKNRRTAEEFENQEVRINCFAGGIAGGIASALTNSFESVTVARQTNP
jgi:hypothetical protein